MTICVAQILSTEANEALDALNDVYLTKQVAIHERQVIDLNVFNFYSEWNQERFSEKKENTAGLNQNCKQSDVPFCILRAMNLDDCLVAPWGAGDCAICRRCGKYRTIIFLNMLLLNNRLITIKAIEKSF